MIATIRWSAFAFACVLIVALAMAGERSTVTGLIALVLGALLVVIFWTYGAFSKRAWFADETESAEFAAVDRDLDRRYGGRGARRPRESGAGR